MIGVDKAGDEVFDLDALYVIRYVDSFKHIVSYHKKEFNMHFSVCVTLSSFSKKLHRMYQIFLYKTRKFNFFQKKRKVFIYNTKKI